MSLLKEISLVKSSRLATLPVLAAALLLGACSSPSNPDVSARQDIMKNYGDAMGVMGDMMKNPDTFDAAKFQEQAAYLADNANSPWKHFQDKEAVGHATDKVWSDADGFRTQAENFQQAATDLNFVAQNANGVADVGAEFKEVGASCKSCHTDYKQKDD